MANRSYAQLSPAAQSQVTEALARPDVTFSSIAAAFNLHVRTVMRLGHKLLTPEEYDARLRRKPKPAPADRRTFTRKGDDALSAVREKLAALKRQQVSLTAEIYKLQEEEANRSIRFELDGEDVRVFGIVAEGFVAHHEQWLRFLNHSGGARLRELIESNFKMRPVKN